MNKCKVKKITKNKKKETTPARIFPTIAKQVIMNNTFIDFSIKIVISVLICMDFRLTK